MNALKQETHDVLAELVSLSPEVRLGQMLAHLRFLSEAHLDKGLGDVDDDELLAVLYRHRTELSDRLQRESADGSQPTDVALSASGSPMSRAN